MPDSSEPAIIAIEGIDRSGKTTQTTLLAEVLRDRGLQVEVISFPRYGSFFGRQIRLLLDGRGATSAATVDPRSMSLWYALDRRDAFDALRRARGAIDAVVLNRYTLSNAVYQAARADPAQAGELFAWIVELEHEQLHLPRPDLTVVLDVEVEVSHARSHRGDRAEAPDVYERSQRLLAEARRLYLAAAAQDEQTVVVGAEWVDPAGSAGLIDPAGSGVAATHERVLAEVDGRLPQLRPPSP